MADNYSQDNPKRVEVRNLNKKVKAIEELENSKKPLTDGQKQKLAGAPKVRKELATAVEAADHWETQYGIGAASAPAPAPAPAPAKQGKAPAAKQAKAPAPAPAPKQKGKAPAGACPDSWIADEAIFTHGEFDKFFEKEIAALQGESPYKAKSRNATKLLNEINGLKEKQAAGQQLTDAQIAKTKRGPGAEKEINDAKHANTLWIHAELLRRVEFRAQLWKFNCKVGGPAPAPAPAPAPKKQQQQPKKDAKQQQPKQDKKKEEQWEKKDGAAKKSNDKAPDAKAPPAKKAPAAKKADNKKDNSKQQQQKAQQQKKEQQQISAAAKAHFEAELAAVQKKERNMQKKLGEIEALRAKNPADLNEAQVKKAKEGGKVKKDLEALQLQIAQIQAQL